MLHVLAVAAFVGFVEATPPATQPTSTPTSPPAAVGPDRRRIDTILEQMESMGEAVQDLRCRVEYKVEDLIGLSEFTKFGQIAYKRAKPNPIFFICFDKMHEGGIVLRRKEWYLFRDGWLSEAKEVSRTTIRREIVRAGEAIDLFSLEKSPFPIPFGQHKDEILEHFFVERVAPKPDDPAETDHLVCRPRPGSRLQDQYSQLEFFVSRSLHLPVKIVAHEADPDGETAKVIRASFPDLTKKSINASVSDDVLALPPETRPYKVIEEPLEEPATTPPAARP